MAHTSDVQAGQSLGFKYLCIAVVALTLPALCLSGFVFFAFYASSLAGSGGFLKPVAALVLAFVLPILCTFGPITARKGGPSLRSWLWLLSPLAVFVGLLALMAPEWS